MNTPMSTPGLLLRRLRMVSFINADLATLQGAVNDYLSGKAVADSVSGTVSYAAGDVGEKTLRDAQYSIDTAGTGDPPALTQRHVIVLFFVE